MSRNINQASAEELRERLALVEAGQTERVSTVLIKPDRDPESPRQWDNRGVMFCKHGRYDLGDKDADDPFDEVEVYDLGGGYWVDENRIGKIVVLLSWWLDMLSAEEWDSEDYKRTELAYCWLTNQAECFEDQRTEQRLRKDVALIHPLYLYDHGGITISMGAFSDRWDSGQVGWIYMTRGVLDREFGGDVERGEACLEGEVETYDNYLTGSVYGYEVWEHEKGDAPEDGELTDSCWGFFGDDPMLNGISDNIDPELVVQLKGIDITY